MEQKQRYSVEELREKGLILLEFISGSQMYGTAIPGKSDVDIRGVFVLPDEDFSHVDFDPAWEEVESGKFINDKGVECEMKFYELRKFLRLLEKNNPNMLEAFSIPDDCLIYKDPLIDLILNRHKDFLTKKSFDSFSGFAYSQTSKARGTNKKQNWEKERFERKGILDFCYVPWKQGTIGVKEWLALKGLKQSQCGLVPMPHIRYTYGLYTADSHKEYCKGIVSDEVSANDVQTAEIKIGEEPIATMHFNKDAWSVHCAEYKSYQVWLNERNEARFVDVKNHGQKIDSKNMMHMQRLLNMATDISEGKGIIARRPEAAELLKIRRGDISLEELLETSQSKINDIEIKFKNSDLPDDIVPGISQELNKTIREQFKNQKI